MKQQAAPEGAGRYDHADPDEGKIDIEPFMEAALEDVVETIMNFGVYPQPRKFNAGSPPQRRLFDLYDWIDEKNVIDPSDLREYFILSLNDYSKLGPFEAARARYEHRIAQMLSAELRGSEIVADRAEDLANEAREK